METSEKAINNLSGEDCDAIMNQASVAPDTVPAGTAQETVRTDLPEPEAQGTLDVRDSAEKAVDEVKDNNYADTVVHEEFTYDLTDEEMAEKATRLAQIHLERAEQESIFKEQKTSNKAAMAIISEEEDSVVDKIRNGQPKTVYCTKRVFFDKRLVQFLQKDNNGQEYVLKERVMEEEDRQMSLDVPLTSDSFVNESDSMDAGSGAVVDEFADESTELEPITEQHLTENKPTAY